MNNLARQNYLKPSPMAKNSQKRRFEIANDMAQADLQGSHNDQTTDYIMFRNMMRAEKRQSFWTGVVLTAGIVLMFTLFFLSMSASGMSFMTCHEFGETFTCRFGGM